MIEQIASSSESKRIGPKTVDVRLTLQGRVGFDFIFGKGGIT